MHNPGHAYGRLDILVNNAGVYIDDQSNELRIKIDVFHTTMATNLHDSSKLCQAFLPLMGQHHCGRVVNVSSGADQINERGVIIGKVFTAPGSLQQSWKTITAILLWKRVVYMNSRRINQRFPFNTYAAAGQPFCPYAR